MGCNCDTSKSLSSWFDLESFPPRNPLELIANAKIVMGANTDIGSLVNSATFGTPAGAWAANPFVVTGAPVCAALETDNNQKIADAAQWNFQNLTWNNAARIAPPLLRLLFLRAGQDWQMNIGLNLGAGLFPSLELSFLDNAGTRGDYAATYPVISWTARNYTGVLSLQMTLKQVGRVRMGIAAIDNGGVNSMFDFEAVLVP